MSVFHGLSAGNNGHAPIAGLPADASGPGAPWPPVAVHAADAAAVGAVTAALAARMAADVGSVAVVAPPGDAGAAVRAGLAGVDHADATTGALGPGVNLVDMHVVKGLEFDAVVVVEPAAILALRPDGGRGGLYTALTRSTRALALVHARALPPELDADPALVRLPAAGANAAWAALAQDARAA